MSRYTWLLDPGHGGFIDGRYQTKGKQSPKLPDGRKLYEGEFNRDVVSRIIELCKANNVKSINIVDSEQDLSLSRRVKKANSIQKENKNCIYLSIHANGFGNGTNFNSANGVSTFYHINSKKGAKLAIKLQDELVKSTKLKDRGAISNDKWASFYVLRKTSMPAILSENGFMTNLKEAKLLLSSDFRDKIALAHFETIMEFEKNGI
jgi:N-acetylmuramoyl-L-alanine amidase